MATSCIKPHTTTFKFRKVLLSIVQKLSKKNLQELAFLYNMGEHLEKEMKINGLRLFQDIINDGKLEHNDMVQITQLVEELKRMEHPKLAKLLIEYSLELDNCYETQSNQVSSLSKSPTTTSTDMEGGTHPSVEQVQDLTTTTTDDTETSSSSDEHQKMEGVVIPCKGRRPSKGWISGNSSFLLKTPNRKRRKRDVGAVDERQLSVELQSSDEVDDEEPVSPHDQQDEEHMMQALNEATLSPDKVLQVGTVIVNKSEGRLLGKGHNRMPKGCESFPWSDKEHDLLNSKYPYVFHSAKAALQHALKQKEDLEGATLYTTLFPANTDAQWIAECGIKELVYLENPYRQKVLAIAAKKIFETTTVNFRRIALTTSKDNMNN